MALATANASIPGNTVRATAANPSRPVTIAAKGALGIRTVIVEYTPGRFTVERWVTSDGRIIASLGQTYYGSMKRALSVSGDWIHATAAANGGRVQ